MYCIVVRSYSDPSGLLAHDVSLLLNKVLTVGTHTFSVLNGPERSLGPRELAQRSSLIRTSTITFLRFLVGGWCKTG